MAELLSTKDVGIYAVMMSLISAFIIVPNTTISDFATPIIFQKFSNLSDESSVKAGIKNVFMSVILSVIILIFSVLITFFVGKYLILLISSSDFTTYYYLLPWLVTGAGMFYIGQTFCFLGMGLNKPKKYLFPKILVGILSPLLNYYFINFWGINGVAYSTLMIGLIYLVHISLINLSMLKELKVQDRFKN
jgi:O-antigen/teichoic acid export membrane protein